MAVTAIILTQDEERHIERCLNSLRDICDRVVVIDSGSTDRTEELCRRHGAEFFQHGWVNYATQFNHGIACAEQGSDWLVRIDADEYLLPETATLVADAIAAAPSGVAGIAVQRRIHFLGKRIAWGGIEPSWQLRIFRAGRGQCEVRWMDEHIVVDGEVQKSRIVVVDDNLNTINWWAIKHLGYANREAIDLLMAEQRDAAQKQGRHVGQAGVKRFIKDRIYVHLPLTIRAFLYFVLRYFVQLGFLDGSRGFLFHFLQGWWYRTIVDVKVATIRKRMTQDGLSLADAVSMETGIRI